MYDKSIKNAYYLLNELWLHREKKQTNNQTKQKQTKIIKQNKKPKNKYKTEKTQRAKNKWCLTKYNPPKK